VAGRAKRELVRAGDIRFGPLQSLVLGLALGWAAVAVKAMLNEAIDGDSGYILLMAGVVTAAWFGGMIGGISATIAAVAMNALVFGGSDGIAAGDPRVEGVRQILFLLIGAGTAILVATRRASRDRLADALDEVASLADDLEGRDARLEIMLSASGTGFWEWDVESGELTWSDAIFEQHGLPVADRAPSFETYLGSIHPEDRGAFQRAITAALDGDDRFGLDFRVVWPDGTIHWTHGAGRLFRDGDGRPLRMIGTGQDITERRRLEDQRDALLAEERRAAEFREAFIDVISHELRTPITTILGLTQLLGRPGRTDDPETRAAMLEDVRAEAERLHRLVEDLLVLSRVERGRLDVDAEPLEPRRLLTRIVDHEAAELPRISIRLDVPPALPIVLGEATYVDQILRNLLGNAAKYTPAGSNVVVDARVEGDVVAIRVSDDGPGIDPASRARLFELFYRDPDSARSVAGSGIGLFVCASLVEAMGGRIWVAEAPGGGAEFGFTLRTADLDDHDLADPSFVAAAADTGAGSGTDPA
jgi:PAS domain S-box-containing protein